MFGYYEDIFFLLSIVGGFSCITILYTSARSKLNSIVKSFYKESINNNYRNTRMLGGIVFRKLDI